VLLATDAPIGIVFRRGPSKLVRVILWNREKDKFTPGQWFKGKWPQGDTWCDGGFFLSNNSYWLDTFHEPLRDDTTLKRVLVRTSPSRMERDGWSRKETGRKTKVFVAFEKQLPKGWTLRLRRNFLKNRYELEQSERYLTLEFPTWEWADWDRKRLVWAEQGCIRAASLGPKGLGAARTLCDFNGTTPTKPE
jgi:hypothetical protein